MSLVAPLVLPAAPAWFRFERDGAARLDGVDARAGRFADLGPCDVHMLL